MKIIVPLVKQEGKGCCGLASLRMVFNYYGDDVPEETMRENIQMHSQKNGGTLTTELAKFAFKRGFSILCYSYDLTIFQPSDIALSPEKLLEKLYEKKEFNKISLTPEERVIKKKGRNGIIYLLENKAEFRLKMPSLHDIKQFLYRKQPVILAINPKILNENDASKIDSGHFIVATGYDNNHFFYNDPGRIRDRAEIEDEKLFFALSNNVLDSSAYLLVLKK